jgi:KDO2-lipid IV(A) lauroyltransferase
MNLKDLLKSKIKTLRYLFEAVAVKFGLWIFYIIGVKRAANVAAKIAIFVGKKISVQKLAYSNLSKALPNLSEAEKAVIIDDMWDNLGRVVGEYPHVAKASVKEISKIIEVSGGARDVINQIKNSGKGSIIFSGHMGNWEIGPKVFASLGLEVHTVYRPLNNPYVEKMTSIMRSVSLIPKSAQGNRRLIEIIKNGGHVLIMADQKISEGEPVKFFHDDAITTTAIARIALKYGVPLFPARAIRIDKNFKFRAEVEKPLEIERTSNINVDVLELTAKMNRRLESWITEYPAQWFWVHNRWKK